MSDRIAGYTVVLEKDTRDGDAHAITDAIRMVKGVQSVEPHVADIGLHIAETRARREIAQQLYELLKKWQL